MAEKRDVRFTDYDTVDTVPGESTVSPTDTRREVPPANPGRTGPVIGDDQLKGKPSQSSRRGARRSLLLYDIPELDDQPVPGIRMALDRPLEKMDELVISIVEDATDASLAREDDINLHKLGIKLTLPEYSGSDTLESFL
jgi:hypothetical protein